MERLTRVIIIVIFAATAYYVHSVAEHYHYVYCKRNIFLQVFFKDSLMCTVLQTTTNVIEIIFEKIIYTKISYIKESLQPFI